MDREPLEVAPEEQGEAAKQPEIRKLKPGFVREVGPVEKTDEEKSYGGEYYPVQRPAEYIIRTRRSHRYRNIHSCVGSGF